MPNEPTRRVISRTSTTKTNQDEVSSHDHKSTSSSSSSSTKDDSSSKEKHVSRTTKDQVAAMEVTTTYVNKEPYNEDEELEETNIDQEFRWKDEVTQKFRDLIDDIKRIKQDHYVDKELLQSKYKDGILLCATMRKLNRVSHLRVNKTRTKTFEEKNKIDEHHLELQNLLYEISHIKKEINKCLEFRSLDEDINLVTVDEFYKNAPVEISNPQVTSTNEHKMKLARLDWELNERQNMINKIKDLEQTIDVYQNEIKTKRNQLDSLHPKLNQIMQACKPTLEYLNMNFDDESNINESVQLLPKPLYTFYMMMLAYRDTIDKTVKVDVIGDVDEAKKYDFNDKFTLDDDDDSGGDSGGEDDAENENYKQKKKAKSNKEPVNKKEKLFTPYPLSVRAILCVKSVGQIILNLYYFNILKIVTVKPELKYDRDGIYGDSSLLKSDSIFNCLYPNDNANESPNLSNKFLFNSLGVKSIEPYTKTIGYPYKWCQLLCGLYYFDEIDMRQKSASNIQNEENNKSEEKQVNGSNGHHLNNNNNFASNNHSMIDYIDDNDNLNMSNDVNNDIEQGDDESFIDDNDIFTYAAKNLNKNEAKIMQKILVKLKLRFKSRVLLQEAINSLRKGVLPTPTNWPNIRQLASKITSFKESNYEKFSTSNYTEHLINSKLINENESFFYELNCVNGGAKLQAQIVINIDYPSVSPLFAVCLDWKHERNFRNDESIRDMERELNICKDNFIEFDEEAAKKFKKSTKLTGLSKNFELLVKQINHLIICFDIYLESESYFLKNNEYPRQKFFLNAVKGKDRKRPYSYIANRDIFVQRANYDHENVTY